MLENRIGKEEDRPLTIKDIARLSGVGVSTVSRVINNTGYVSDDVREKVNNVIREYNFTPNTSARNLKGGASRNIALLVKGITNPFFNKMIRIIEEKCALRGYPIFIQNVDAQANELEIAIREKRDRNLCGVILLGGNFGYSEKAFRTLGIPAVLVTVSANEDIPKELYSSVKLDDEKEAYNAVKYLIDQGHREIGFIYNPPGDQLTPNRLRFEGYKRALAEAGIDFKSSLVASYGGEPLHSGYISGFRACQELMARNARMTAIFAFADVLALGASKAILSSGRRIPEDISVIGFDGIEEGEFFSPSLDTVYQPAEEMALASIEALFDMLQGGPAQHKIFNAVLMRRGSCGKAPSGGR